MKKARTLFCSTRSQTHSPSESYARWRTLEPLGFARRQRPPCKRDADTSELKADHDGDHVANGLGWLRMRQTKTYWHRKTARSEFRAEPQQPGPACGACQCRNLDHCRQSRTSQHGSHLRRCSIVFGPKPTSDRKRQCRVAARQTGLSPHCGKGGYGSRTFLPLVAQYPVTAVQPKQDIHSMERRDAARTKRTLNTLRLQKSSRGNWHLAVRLGSVAQIS